MNYSRSMPPNSDSPYALAAELQWNAWAWNGSMDGWHRGTMRFGNYRGPAPAPNAASRTEGSVAAVFENCRA